MYQIAKNKLNELYGAISAKEDLFLPVQKAGQTNYGLWTEEAVVDIDTLKTVKSGKDCFFPQSEVLYKSRYEGGKVSIDPAELQNQPFVVFGMRACDVRAVKVYGDELGASLFPLEIYSGSNRNYQAVNYPYISDGDLHNKALENFIDAIEGKEEVLVKAGEGAYIQMIIEALYKSAEKKEPVFL